MLITLKEHVTSLFLKTIMTSFSIQFFSESPEHPLIVYFIKTNELKDTQTCTVRTHAHMYNTYTNTFTHIIVEKRAHMMPHILHF